MKKDIIYIDVEDDITAIIGKVKDANEKIVALVPPKSVGVLQSAVNLRLLARAAKQANKRLVLITNNAALTALAAAAQLPIAKNLQSKPEIAQIPALDVDDGDDVIDGSQLPVGELMRTADKASIGAAAISDSAVDEVISGDKPAPIRATAPVAGQMPARGKVKKGTKVPNFNKFRKKFIFIIGGLVLLIGFLVWALVFAPHATVVITARTTDTAMNKKVTLADAVTTDATAGTIKAAMQSVKKAASVEIIATGTKDVGDKAGGTVVFSTGDADTAIGGLTIPAGTELTSTSGLTYVTDSAVVIGITNYRNAPVEVTAAESGAKYNGASGSLSGAPKGMRASFKGASTGGTDKTVKIITADDVDRAKSKLDDQDTAPIKKQLTDQFGANAAVIDASFKVDASAVKPTPDVGAEAPDSKGVFSGEVTYTLTGVAKAELSTYLDEYFKAQIADEASQRLYDNGADKVTFTNVTEANGSYSVNISASAKTGPKINDSDVKTLSKGKRYGEVQAALEAIQGVDNVDIKFSPFWVNSVPKDINKISVEFSLDAAK